MSEVEKLSFTDIENMSDREIRKLNLDIIIKISLNEISTNQNDSYKIFNHWANRLLKIFYPTELHCLGTEKLFSTFVNYVHMIINNLYLDTFTDDLLALLVTFITDWKIILSYIKEVINEFNVKIIYLIFRCALLTLHEYYTFIKQGKSAQNKYVQFSSNFSKVCCESRNFQSMILSIMMQHISIFICTDITLQDELIRILIGLCSLGEDVSFIDVKSTAEMWKFISKLCSENANFFKINLDSKNGFMWLIHPITFLCEEIRTSISSLYEQINKEPIDRIERIVKINSFYLKVLVKFASDFDHKYFQCHIEVVEMVFIVIAGLYIINNKEIYNLIKDYLVVGLMNIFSFIFKNKEFVMALYNKTILSTEDCEVMCLILHEIFQLLLTEDSNIACLYFEEENELNELFIKMIQYPEVLLKRENYEKMITITSALLVSKCDNPKLVTNFENFLIKGILQNNLLLLYISLDIWFILLRFANREMRCNYIQFWIKCNSNFTLHSIEPRSVCTEGLIKGLYNFLTISGKEEVRNEYLQNDQNKRTILAMRNYKIPIEDNLYIPKDVFKRIWQILQDDYLKWNIESYYELVFYFKLLETGHVWEDNNNFFHLVVNLLLFLCGDQMIISKHNNLIIHILQVIYIIANNLHIQHKMELINAFGTIRLQKIHTAIASCIIKCRDILKHETSLKLKADNTAELKSLLKMQHFSCMVDEIDFSNNIIYDKDIILSYFKQSDKSNFKHICKNLITSITNVRKKSRLDTYNQYPPVKNAFEEMNRLSHYYENHNLHIDDKALIEKGINILSKIVNKNTET